MKIQLRRRPRSFSPIADISLKDMGTICLADNEQLTFATKSGKTNDIVKKEWGFYLSNSLNVNLRRQGFRTALVISLASGDPRLYLNLVERSEMCSFRAYLKKYDARVLCWLDEPSLTTLKNRKRGA